MFNLLRLILNCFLVVSLIIASSNILQAQDEDEATQVNNESPTDDFEVSDNKDTTEDLKNQLAGGLGLSVIDGETYMTLFFNPEIAIWKIGIGLDIFLRISTKTGKIREQDYSDGAYRKIIRYIRYGYKNKPDPLYVRVGALDNATLGNGFLITNYNNSPSFEDRTIGLEFDMDFTKWGIESIYGNFAEAGIIGVRPFVRPFKFTGLKDVWIIGDIEFGFTYVTDVNEKAKIIEETSLATRTTPGNIAQLGADVQMPIIRNSFFYWILYANYGHIVNYGDGQGYGTGINFNIWSFLNLGIKLERRNLGEKFIPAYFNSLYEIQRYQKLNGITITKASQIEKAKASGGSYGYLLIRILKYFIITGAYQKSDDSPDGNFHAEASLPEIPIFDIRAGYDRVGIQNAEDLFKLDDRSLLFAFLGYKLVDGEHFRATLGFKYQWTFEPVGDTYKVQERFEPVFSLSYRW